ncbi:MAG TPA: Ig-like domain-containing protein [Verrucomicrobiae bacterium]|nr:Ig-like domain-containing protein [Verrucomicrobiae bacterium]
MLKWAVTVAMGVLLALPLCAQDKNVITANNWDATSENSVAATNTARDFSIAPASPRLFAMPAAAAGKPADIFSDWADNPWNRGAWGRLTPKYEVAGLFSYINFDPGSEPNFNNYGATGSFAYNANRWLGLVAEVGGYTFSRKVYMLPSGASQEVLSTIKGDQWTYLFGPRLNFRHFDHFVPFVEILFGDARGNPNITGDVTQSSFGMAAGGGIDVVLSKNISWRFVEADYLMTNYSGPDLAASARQNNFRIGSGIVFRLGYPPAPPKPNHPPVAACSAAAPSVYQGSTDVVAIHVNASDPDNDPLTYSYTATGGTVDGTGPDARWNPSGLALGSYTINVKVDDGRGGTATCAADVAVAKRPNSPPVISCAPERNPIIAGERVAIISRASDPDGDPITYSYSATGGQISGTTATAQFDSTGLAAGSYGITCTADDGRGGRTSAPTNVDVQAPAPPPQASKVGDCGYTKVAASRFDNACKRVGDDVALRLKNEPNSKLVIVGFADPKEPKAAQLAETRAELAKKYLGEKGIDASRISTRAGAASTEKGMEKENRRVDFVFVPEGATY